MANGSARTAVNATPVFLCPAPGALTKNYAAAVVANKIANGPGFVGSILVNTGAGASTIQLYDGDPGAGGTSLGIWATTAVANIPLGLPFTASLYATVVNNPNVTVTYSV